MGLWGRITCNNRRTLDTINLFYPEEVDSLTMLRGAAIFVLMLFLAGTLLGGPATNTAAAPDIPEEPGYYRYFEDYVSYAEYTESLAHLENEYSDIMKVYDITSWTEFGSTWEGRSVWAIKISDNPGLDEPDEPKVIIVGEHHAREWMSFMVPWFYTYYLLHNYNAPPTDNDGDGQYNEDPVDGVDNDDDAMVDEDPIEGKATWLVNNREIWIIPMLNPDGYEYSRDGNDWRKNFRDNNANGRFDPGFDGVDINRNYPYMWNSQLDPQTGKTMDNTFPASDMYRGPPDNVDDDGDGPGEGQVCLTEANWIDRPGFIERDFNNCDEDPVNFVDDDGDGIVDEDRDGGFSEPETQAIFELMKRLDIDDNPWNRKHTVGMSISYHSYSELVIWPWGYNHEPTSDGALFEDIGTTMASMNGYTPGQGTTLYPVSGDYDDWMYGSNGVLSYTIELNSGDEGGFHPPPELIIPTALKNLGPNLYVSEWTGVGRVAADMDYPSLDINLPVINHTQKNMFIPEGESYRVVASVGDNGRNLDKDSVHLYYRADGGSWQEMKMERDGGGFEATIPPQPVGSMVSYYITARDTRGLDVFSPIYGDGEPYFYYIDTSLGTGLADIGAVIIMMALMFGIIYTGLIKSLKMAMAADKRKAIEPATTKEEA